MLGWPNSRHVASLLKSYPGKHWHADESTYIMPAKDARGLGFPVAETKQPKAPGVQAPIENTTTAQCTAMSANAQRLEVALLFLAPQPSPTPTRDDVVGIR